MNTDELLAPSADNQSMLPYWRKVDAITTGVEALRTQKYLPRFPMESDEGYAYRMRSTVLVDIFSDIVESLAGKPFAREAGLADDSAPDQIKAFIEDVDRSDNHLHVFAQQVFFAGVAYGLDWILVDYPEVPEGATLADERDYGARPYFVRVRCSDMLEVRSDHIGGREVITYARINESVGDIRRVRIFRRDGGRATWELWQSLPQQDWVLGGAGVVSIGEIPIVPYYTGRRDGASWRFTMPMRGVADLQIEHYQSITDLKLTKQQSAYPMLIGNGMSPPKDEHGNDARLPVGPGRALYSPMNDQGQHGSWEIIEPAANTLVFLSSEADKLEAKMREMGRIPLTAGTAGMTQIAVAFSSQRASAAVQAWAYQLKDVLERALRLATRWMGIDYDPTVYIDTDFAINLGDDRAPELLLRLYEVGALTLETLLREFKRRSILSAEMDTEEEILRLLEESTTKAEE